ncbi:peptidase inhibitor 16 [Tupaia chinensis]|uniref:peptidase inhibitor 16 n=1 Tax=Tupaia chinensis TaxID=246437 RepID=UPI0003C8FC42|nr:peptidase inhibitor 16 [Tupaia chinensis]XP_006148689.1 peptidase inhibitor 16 [Tupaia chinensis]XP_027627731.1 peptidase inhibitor 16 [Tupaia chinensis]
MSNSCGLLALLPLLLLVASAGPAGALKDEEKRLMVELHNLYRAQVTPPASNMLQMSWDDELAAFAKAYAQQCVWGHNKERGRRGENLFAITDEGVDVHLAMEEWHHEREHYNLSAAACDPGQVCGHYTQVVWAKTERIGCGSHFCEKLQGVEETNIELLVCNYEPPGNVRGRKPYEEGTPCSQCPSGYSCKNALCEPTRGPAEAQDFPSLVTEAPSSLAPEASDPNRTVTPSLATKSPSFLVTKVSGSLATNASSTVATKASASLATKDPFSMATGAPPSRTTEAPSLSSAHSLPGVDERPVTLPKSTRGPTPRLAVEVHSTRVPSMSPERSLHSKMSPTGTGEPLPHAPEEAEAEAQAEEAKVPPSEVSASAFPAQDKPGELQATLDHTGHTSSKSLPRLPNPSATAKAMGGRALALQSSWAGAEGPDNTGFKSGLNSGPGRVWGPLLGLLLLPPLLLAGIF